MTFDWDWRWAWDPRLSGRLKKFTYAGNAGGPTVTSIRHPAEAGQLAGYWTLPDIEHRGEAYAREELAKKPAIC